MASTTQFDEIDSTETGQNITVQNMEAGKQLSCMNATLTDLQPQSEPGFRLAAIGNNMFSCGPDDSRLKGRPKPRVWQLKYPVVGEVIDVNGDWWDVRDVRSTRHGFDLCFGNPANERGVFDSGLPRLIATKPLWDFWEANQTKSNGFLYDLPAGRTTLKRLRKRLGFNFNEDRREFFMDRIEDLDSLRSSEFAVKHAVETHVASGWRRRIIGLRTRKSGWWRKAKVRRILLSNLTLREAGRKLGIGISHAKRLRDRVKLEAQLLSIPVDDKVTLIQDRTRYRE